MVRQEAQREQTASMEDYLEAIAKLGEEREVVKVKQLSQMLGVKMPSVTSALKKLSDQELVEHERYGNIKLTAAGGRLAREVISRHEALTHFFEQALGISHDIAEDDACRIEHVISSLTMERLTGFLKFLETYSLGKASIFRQYKYHLEHGQHPEGGSTRGVRRRK